MFINSSTSLRPHCVAIALMLTAHNAFSAPVKERRVLEEVIVSAQKVEQSSQDVPISLTAVSGEFMKEVGAVNLQDLAPYMPNVRFSSDTDPALTQVNIRGFGSNPLNAAFESSVGFVQDEVFYNRPSYFSEAMFDIARIEVLRGPQGTLFGKNTVAGVFNVSSADPTDDFSGKLQWQENDADERYLEAAVAGGVGDHLSLRFSAMDRDKEGDLYNQFLQRRDDQHEQNAQRLKIFFDPSDSLHMELNAYQSETMANYWGLQIFKLDDDTRTFLENYDPNIEDNPYDFRSSYNVPGFIEKASDSLSLLSEWQLGDVAGLQNSALTLIVADSELYIDSLVDLDASPADLAKLAVTSDYNQQSLELRFTASSESLFGLGEGVNLVAGIYALHSEFEQQTQITAGDDLLAYLTTDDALQLISGNTNAGSGGLLGGLNLAGLGLISGLGSTLIGDDSYLLDYFLDVEAYAAFAQFSWYITDKWVLTPGLRYSRETKTADASGASRCRTGNLGLPCLMGTALSAEEYQEEGIEREESDLSPKLSLQYYLNEDTNVFISYARGYKSGGFNASSFGGEDLNFEPEKAVTVEAGLKGSFLDNTLRFNLAVYQTQFENLQVLAFNGAFFDVKNAATATSDGLEMDVMWITPMPFLRLAGSVGLLDARYDSYPAAPAPINEGVDAQQDLGGRRISFAPKETASFTPTLEFPVFGLAMSTSVDILYQGDQYTDGDLDKNTFSPGYTTVSARVSLASLDSGWAITVGGSNLTDEEVLGQVLDTVFFPGTYNTRQKSMRKIFASLNYQW